MEVGEHYRPVDGGGIYRVVGTTDDIVLLQVTDGDGRRVHTGTVRRVEPDTIEDEFEPASDPDAGVSPAVAVRNGLQGLYWSVRRFLP